MKDELVRKALKKASEEKKAKSKSDVSPFKDAMREAYKALKKDDFDTFAEAFENAVSLHSKDAD